MRNREESFVAGMMLCAVLFSGAVDNSWIERVPEADRSQSNPFAGQADAVSAGSKLFAEHCAKCHGSDALGRGKRPKFAQQRSAASLRRPDLLVLEERQLASWDALLEFAARTFALANHRVFEKPRRAAQPGREQSGKRERTMTRDKMR